MNSPLELARQKAFDMAIKRKLGDSIILPENEPKPEDWSYILITLVAGNQYQILVKDNMMR